MLDLVGQRFGRLTVIAKTDQRCGRNICWLCQCDCGNEIIVIGFNLKRGTTKSCGCLREEKTTTHGKTKTRTYDIWSLMKNRCSNPHYSQYEDYGGRGIAVCDRWLKFENFLEDMGEAPGGLSIEREDNDLGYYKENCIWATRKQQGRNKRNNRLIEFNGRIQCVSAWAEELVVKCITLFNRLKRGWSIQKALTTPVKKRDKK